ncbi:hypothetical protein GCM10009544_01750 [Streptomyces stramineus]|uniref:Uncharacterized protein n=1 Tax=Streptomyces stramineus TaxID=173861 RepID=A0ABN0ZC81_9ACTN
MWNKKSSIGPKAPPGWKDSLGPPVRSGPLGRSVTEVAGVVSSGVEVACGEAAVDEAAAVLEPAEAVPQGAEEVVGVGKGGAGLVAAPQQWPVAFDGVEAGCAGR